MGKLKCYLLRLHRDERGAMSTEMILIIALIAVPLLVALAIFRNTIKQWFIGAQSDLDCESGP